MSQETSQAEGRWKLGRPSRTRTFKWWVKRWTARKRRRQAKRDPENAPKKNQYQGYAD